uniref:Secreted protein n=1 Tax=Eptatretus burgeri TaxID=7764 RepID=A0A8C4QT11_EPTBU
MYLSFSHIFLALLLADIGRVPECLVPTVKDSRAFVMLCGALSWQGLDAVIPLKGNASANHSLIVLTSSLLCNFKMYLKRPFLGPNTKF